MILLENTEYGYGESEFTLKVDKLAVNKGELVALTGPSGSGKSTLLRVISGEQQPDKGTVTVNNQNLASLSEHALRKFRLLHIGLFTQNQNLLNYLNVRENILLVKSLDSSFKVNDEWQQIADKCGIPNLMNRFPSQLSEGEKQRVSLCRALSGHAELILADEPTSNLDSENSKIITQTLLENCRKFNRTLVMVTHDLSLLEQFDRSLEISSLGKAE